MWMAKTGGENSGPGKNNLFPEFATFWEEIQLGKSCKGGNTPGRTGAKGRKNINKKHR